MGPYQQSSFCSVRVVHLDLQASKAITNRRECSYIEDLTAALYPAKQAAAELNLAALKVDIESRKANLLRQARGTTCSLVAHQT